MWNPPVWCYCVHVHGSLKSLLRPSLCFLLTLSIWYFADVGLHTSIMTSRSLNFTVTTDPGCIWAAIEQVPGVSCWERKRHYEPVCCSPAAWWRHLWLRRTKPLPGVWWACRHQEVSHTNVLVIFFVFVAEFVWGSELYSQIILWLNVASKESLGCVHRPRLGLSKQRIPDRYYPSATPQTKTSQAQRLGPRLAEHSATDWDELSSTTYTKISRAQWPRPGL